MKKIDILTAEQESAMMKYREEWLAIGRSTDKADRITSERVFKEMYAALGKPEPQIWWCDGPATGAIIRTLLTNKDNNLRASLGASLRDNLWANLRASLGDNLRANLRANLGDNLGANLWDNLGANLWDNLGDNLGDNLSFHFWGHHESAWPAYYAWPHLALRPIYDVKQLHRLEWWTDLSKSCGWWEPYEGVVFACERPLRQSVDERGRLHCADGPALICRDGWLVYAFHNVRVPADIIENPSSITADRIKAESNAEVRRVMMHLFGFDRYVREIGAKLINSDSIGKLWRVEDEAPFHIAEVINSTPEPDGTVKIYFVPAPDENDLTRKRMKTCREAIAWSFGLQESEYWPSVQT